MEQEIILDGHLLDSLTLPKVMDLVLEEGGNCEILEVKIGTKKTDLSHARLLLEAATTAQMNRILQKLRISGAISVLPEEAKLVRAPKNGVFPEGFYSTTNLETEVYFKGRWVRVKRIEMDCGVVIDRRERKALCLPMNSIRKGDWIVVGSRGVKVIPLMRERGPAREIFQFMGSGVSSEKPKGRIIAQIADEMRQAHRKGKKILFVVGPAVVHTGANIFLEKIIRAGYADVLFSGNGFATHDIERQLYGTSLGVYLEKGESAEHGHDHHVRAINRIRMAGGIAAAVRKGILKKGVMAACIQHRVKFVLGGSVRDDGPLPEVIRDTQVAQQAMRDLIPGVGISIMVASGLHAIATGNILPASVKTVFVDINPAMATKLSDRGTFQSVSLVTDSEPFLRELCRNLVPSGKV
ncbi:MAG: TIGR00300 family protein [Deltaproteobacteria bacterium]|nr:TIGR00300 family protein [Deltaproteobacteria bacterium]